RARLDGRGRACRRRRGRDRAPPVPRASRSDCRRRQDRRAGPQGHQGEVDPADSHRRRAAYAGVRERHRPARVVGAECGAGRDRRELADGGRAAGCVRGGRHHDVPRQTEADRDRVWRGRDRDQPGGPPHLSREEGESRPLVEPRDLRAEGRLMSGRGRRGGLALALAVFVTVAGARTARAQDLSCGAGDVEVTRLVFEGNAAFPSSLLADGIATEASSWWQRTIRFPAFLGTRRCLDHQLLALDRVRLIVFYRNHGYASVAVDTIVTPMGKGKAGVLFAIHEGAPTIVDSLSITGLDSVPERANLLQGLPVRKGRPYDKYVNDTTRDLLVQRLHNGGYPDAEVFINDSTDIRLRRATVAFAVTTGERMRLGPITVNVDPRRGAKRGVTDGTVRHLAGLKEGDLYSQQQLERAKLALYQTQAFARVTVIPDSVRTPGDSTVPVTLGLTEGYLNEAH